MTPAQIATWKADIAANANQINGVAISAIPYAGNSDNAYAIADWYNLLATPDFFGNYKNVPAESVMNAIKWKSYTPADAVPTADAVVAAVHAARTAFAGSFQMNLQTMLMGRQQLDATKPSTIQGLKDATDTNMPMGAAGANVKGGWSDIQKILCRKGNRIEKLLANVAGGNGGTDTTAATFVFEGSVSYSELV